MFLACHSCKFVMVSWPEDKVIFTNHVINSLPICCPKCYAEMKIVIGPPPITCHHGINIAWTCQECKKQEKDKDIERRIDRIFKVY